MKKISGVLLCVVFLASGLVGASDFPSLAVSDLFFKLDYNKKKLEEAAASDDPEEFPNFFSRLSPEQQEYLRTESNYQPSTNSWTRSIAAYVLDGRYRHTVDLSCPRFYTMRYLIDNNFSFVPEYANVSYKGLMAGLPELVHAALHPNSEEAKNKFMWLIYYLYSKQPRLPMFEICNSISLDLDKIKEKLAFYESELRRVGFDVNKYSPIETSPGSSMTPVSTHLGQWQTVQGTSVLQASTDDLSDRLTSDPNPTKTASALRAVSQKGSAEEPSWIKKNPRAATAIGVTASVSALAVVGTLVRKYLLKQKQKKEEEKEQLLAKFKVKQ